MRSIIPTLTVFTALICAQAARAQPVRVDGARGIRGALAGEPPGQPFEHTAPAAPRLQRGATGGEVGILQTRLNDERRARGERAISVDADFGPGTEAAVKAFQASAGLPRTGVVDARTWAALVAATKDGPLGDVNIAAFAPTADKYSRKNKGPRVVGIHPLEPLVPGDERTRPLAFESKLAVDADGAGDAWRGDPWGQPDTSLRDRSGRSVNPERLNYFVLPVGFDAKHPGMKLGDIAAVIYRGQVAYAIYADRGPRTKIGEGSIALARALGINPSPTRGGTSGGVTYVVFPGSGTGRPLTQAEIDRRGAELLRRTRG